MGAFTRGLKTFFRILLTLLAFVFRPKLLVFVFQLFAYISLLVFLVAYYYAFQTFRVLHKEYLVGHLQSSECGFEYMEKESGIHHLYDALTNPERPLQNRIQVTLNFTLYVIALLSVAVFCLTMYYLTNDPDQPSFRRDALNIGWITLTKMGLYLRYILLPSIAAIGLLLYYNSRSELFVPDFRAELEKKEDTLEDPAFKKEKTKELDRSVDATVTRQKVTPGLMLLIMTLMLAFYVPTIPIHKALISTVYVMIVMSALIMMQFTKFFGRLQLILHTKYVNSVEGVNLSAAQMLDVPEFRRYIITNAKRVEQYSDEPFQDNQVDRLRADKKLHYYVQHHATRNDELAFMTAVERGKTRSNKVLTWSPMVNRIRGELGSMREADAEVRALFKKTNRWLFLTFMIPLFIVVYVGFHLMYLNNQGTTMTMVVLVLLVVFVFVLIKNMASLARPKDPEHELEAGR